MLTADQMRTLPEFFADIPDPRRKQGRRRKIEPVSRAQGCATSLDYAAFTPCNLDASSPAPMRTVYAS